MNLKRESSLFVSLIGLIILILGWGLNIELLKSIDSHWISIKPLTCVLFITSGLLLYLIHEKSLANNKRQLFISSLTFLMFAIIFSLSWDSLHHFLHGDNYDNFKEQFYYPGWITIVCFSLIAFRGLTYIFDTNKVKLVKSLGFIISMVGLSGICGYLFNLPKLYFYFNENSSGISIITSGLFLILGGILFKANKTKKFKLSLF